MIHDYSSHGIWNASRSFCVNYHTYYDFLKWEHSVPTIGWCCDSFSHIRMDKILRKKGMFLLTELDWIFLYITFACVIISSPKSWGAGWLDTCNSSDCPLGRKYAFHSERQSAGAYGQALLVRRDGCKTRTVCQMEIKPIAQEFWWKNTSQVYLLLPEKHQYKKILFFL